MSRLKKLSLPFASLLVGLFPATAHAQNTFFSLGTDRTYRQSSRTNVEFRGGSLNVFFRDGLILVDDLSCQRAEYWSPNVPLDPCPLGATGFLTFGAFGSDPVANPYLSVTSVIPATVIEPGNPDLPNLFAAPASKLPRPLFGFQDGGVGLFFNLQEVDLRESKVSLYSFSRNYLPSELRRMNEEVVPGTYYFRFPRLNAPNIPVTVTPAIRTMPEGYAKVNSRFTGFRFDTGLGFDPDGFLRVSASRPAAFRWEGLSPTLVNSNTDRLYFSIKYLSEPTDPLAETTSVNPGGIGPAALFPGFITGRTPRILLQSPLVTSFTTPPIFKVGDTGVVQLELDRVLPNNAAILDTSSRIFQIPIRFVSTYADFALRNFGSAKSKVGFLEDFDGDGFNNLTEWTFNTRANVASDTPKGPTPVLVPSKPVVPATDPPSSIPAYFGFNVKKPIGLIPDVAIILQRRTTVNPTAANWTDVVTDANWTLTETDTTIQLASKTGTPAVPTAPPGSSTHQYRFRVIQTGL